MHEGEIGEILSELTFTSASGFSSSAEKTPSPLVSRPCTAMAE
jgi:hypothetical protein